MSENNKCLGCYAKSVQIAFLKQQIAILKKEVARLKRIIQEARQTAGAIQSEAHQIMSEHRPRGVWSFAKGARQAAQRIAHRLTC